MKIGDRIRTLRKEANLTLEELSKNSGVALATLSRMENDKMTGTLDSHVNIARALGVPLTELYAEVSVEEKKAEFQRHTAAADTFVHTQEASFRILTGKVLTKKMMPIMLTILPGGKTNNEEANKGAEKFIYVMEGELEATVGSETFKLGKKDTLYFDASLPHSFKNIGKGPINALCVICPPSL